MRLLSVILLLASLAAGLPPAMAQSCDTHSGLPVPRFVSLKFESVNGRSGPSLGHPIAWEYVRAGLPMEVTAETADWRRVRDPGGEETWMHRRVLSGRRSVLLQEDTALRARPETEGVIEAEAEGGAVLWLERCRTGWCRVEAGGERGWIPARALWGVYEHERDPAAEPPASAQCSAAGIDDSTGLSD
jgi:SH3-like domain-containing protein